MQRDIGKSDFIFTLYMEKPAFLMIYESQAD